MTNGTLIEVNETGTSFAFTPGSLIGDTVEHECCKHRAIGYYLEVIMALAPFCKKPLSVVLRGVTNNQVLKTHYYLRLFIFVVVVFFF